MFRFISLGFGILCLLCAGTLLFYTPAPSRKSIELPAPATAQSMSPVMVTPQRTAMPTSTTEPTTTPAASGEIEATVEAYLAQSKSVSAAQPPITTQAVSTAAPIRLTIPSLKLDALIEQVGQRSDGAMDTPSLVEDVGWYRLGVAPGEVGRAVIAGHLDLVDGSPAVFWDIGKLEAGDEVIVYVEDGTEYHFRVMRKQRYAYEDAPLEEIFGFSLRSELNLITCAGTWDRKESNYASRLVVYTRLFKTVSPTARLKPIQ